MATPWKDSGRNDLDWRVMENLVWPVRFASSRDILGECDLLHEWIATLELYS